MASHSSFDPDTYKSAKIAFVSNTSGSSIQRILLISSVPLASLLLHDALALSAHDNYVRSFIVQWSLLVFPLLLAVSQWLVQDVNSAALVGLLLLIGVIVFLLAGARKDGKRSTEKTDANVSKKASANRITSLTTYRAHMLLLTSICILAVDYPLFPRDLAKCETFGISLMDIGVGSFVFSQGLVSAKGFLALQSQTSSIKAGSTSTLKELWHLLRKTLPLCLLGLLRILLVKGVDYAEHASEYGTHWNFFFTLFLVPVFESLLRPVLLQLSGLTCSTFSSLAGPRNDAMAAAIGPAAVGLGISIFHTFLLTTTPLQTWTLSAPRTDLLTHNKEGIVSLPGYLAIHIFGLAIGIVVLSPPSSASEKSDSKASSSASDSTSLLSSKLASLIYPLTTYAILFWSLLVFVMYNVPTGDVSNEMGGMGRGAVSRRLANLPYALFTAAYNTLFLLSYIVLDTFLARSSSLESTSVFESRLLNKINKRGLIFFLVANVLTGLTNLLLPTLYASDTLALAAWSVYTAACCGVVWLWDDFSSSKRGTTVTA